MSRLSRRALLAGSAAGLTVVACSPLVPPGPGRSSTPTSGTPVGTGPGATPVPVSGSVDGFFAVAPRVLRTGQAEAITLALFHGQQPAEGPVSAVLSKGGQPVASGNGQVSGRGTVSLDVPSLADGEYDLQVKAGGLTDQAKVQVQDGTLCFVETDKPIYKPGQTMHIRVMALNPALTPARGTVLVEVQDATGAKVFRKSVATDEYGMATLDLPLSDEPNLGTWKLHAALGANNTERDVRVERYVLPKFEVQLNLAKDWALASEAIKGTVTATYSFGKPVGGTAEVIASRYVGTWQQYARVSAPIDGKAAIEVPAVRYAAGSPAAGGLAQVRLDVTVREQATGYEETTTELVNIASTAVTMQLIPESSSFKPGLPFSALAILQTPDKQPVDGTIRYNLTYFDQNVAVVQQESYSATTRNGAASFSITPPARAARLRVDASSTVSGGTTLEVAAGYSPSGSFIQVQQVGSTALKVGGAAQFKVLATKEARNFYYEVLA
ncbi:MAG TPA: MG2 domain-containing protein, partial [Chloroflexota bacterium]|nr:MG2 domain-containing protein [Chloroflexota bacterium]